MAGAIDAAPRRKSSIGVQSPRAKEGQDACREGNLTFEEAMMEAVKSLFLAKVELQHRLDHASSPNGDEPVVDP